MPQRAPGSRNDSGVIDLVTTAPLSEWANARSSSRLVESAPAAFIRQKGKETPAIVGAVLSIALSSINGSDTDRLRQPQGFSLFLIEPSRRNLIIMREGYPQVLGTGFGKEAFFGRNGCERIGVVGRVPGQ